jgi:DNA repair exonuclease SbcCD ATPase subunit
MSGRGRGGLKCPSCNNKVKSFCKIYISAPEEVGDDDVSLSSVESVVEEEDGEPKDETNEEGESETAITTTNDIGSQPNHPIDIEEEQEMSSQSSEHLVDLTMSPERAPPSTTTTRRRDTSISASSKTSPNSATKDPVQRYKKIAKKHKRRVQILESQRREENQKEATLLEQRREANAKLEKVEQELEAMERECESDQLELGHLRLVGVRLKNENTYFTQELQEHKKRTKTAEEEFQKLRDSYKAGLEDARSTSMAEVKHILDQYPIITVENQELRERYRKLKSQMESISKHLPSEHHESSSKPKKRKRDSDVAKDLRQMQEAYIPGGGGLRRTNSKEPPAGLSASSAQKYSSQALRMSLAGQKKTYRTTSAVLAEMEPNRVTAKPAASLGKSQVRPKSIFEGNATKSRGSLAKALGRQKSLSLPPLASTSLNFAKKKKFSPFAQR